MTLKTCCRELTNDQHNPVNSPDKLVLNDDWSDLSQYRELPDIDFDQLYAYRIGRIRSALSETGAAMCVLVNPISLRYAVDYRAYGLFQSHIPTTYLFVPQEGPVIIHGVYGPPSAADAARPGRPISFFDGGDDREVVRSQLPS